MATAARIALSSLPNGTLLVKQPSGQVIAGSGATAFVYQHGTTTQVSVFSAETGAGTLGQPLTADTRGQAPGFVADGQDIDVVWTFSGVTNPAAMGEPEIASKIPASYADDITAFGYANGPNFAIGSGFPNISIPAAHGNTAFGIGGRAGVPTTGPLGQLTTGVDNTAFGSDTLTSLTTGSSNIAVGADSMSSLVSGSQNVAVGTQALENLITTTISANVAIGQNAMNAATTATNSVAVGWGSLGANLAGTLNVAVGYNALAAGTTGSNNVAVGNNTLTNTTSSNNVAVGSGAATHVADGNNITAVGSAALGANVSGFNCTALGASSLANATGNHGTAVGYQAGLSVVAGTNCTIVGSNAGNASTTDNNYMTLVGYGAIGTGAGAVAIGVDSGGASATASANQIRLGTANHTLSVIGNASIAGAGKTLGFYGATAIVQPSAVGTATGYTAGATVGTFHTDDTYSGNVGTIKYTINGVVAALKNLGLIAS